MIVLNLRNTNLRSSLSQLSQIELFKSLSSQEHSWFRIEFNSLLVKCDLDGDGYIDFEEFKEMIMRSRERKELAKLREEAEMLAISDEELETIEEITETVSTPDREEEIEEEIETAEDQDNSDVSVEEDIEDESEDEI